MKKLVLAYSSKKIKQVRRNLISKVMNHSYTVPNLDLYECLSCKEKIYDRRAMKKIEAYSPAFHQKLLEKKSGVSSDSEKALTSIANLAGKIHFKKDYSYKKYR